tara:strand:- start:70 stop:483 length:414 start_codon:yes stop_codon:yes gene_type:complete
MIEKDKNKKEKVGKIMDMEMAILIYKKFIGDNYENWTLGSRSLLSDDNIAKRIKENSVKEFKDCIDYDVGNKYIKVVKREPNSASVHSFIVNTHNDKKFKYGDILKAASWKSPARNFPRGNVFTTDYARTNISWCGA